MNLSPLQLEHYFVTELNFRSNREFDAEGLTEVTMEHLEVEKDCKRIDKQSWQVTLDVRLLGGPDANLPCTLSLQLVGMFAVLDNYPVEKEDRMVEINGPSMLYGIAREIIRGITARGPYFPLLLPSATFFTPPAETSSESVVENASESR